MADNVLGKNIMLYYHEPASETYPEGRDIAFACSTNCSFSVNVDQKEVTSQTSAWYREYKNDIASWSITCDGLITLDGYGYLFLLQQQQNRTTDLEDSISSSNSNKISKLDEINIPYLSSCSIFLRKIYLRLQNLYIFE